ncbi:MAG: MBL fold metallo-hydrolase [Clostridia bacterium]|nr:MBL fold metallo-hydrolase [Clostridia bacterium]
MSIQEHLGAHAVPYKDMMADYKKRNEDFFRHPSKYYMKPFRILGDLWYVGDTRVCVHLLDTHDGLILFDSGFPHTVHMLTQAIWEAGFDPRDIRYIIHSHGHYDHFGAANDFRELYGCKILLSAADAAMLRDNPATSFLEHIPCPLAENPVPDIEMQDGDIIRLGDVAIRCVLVPSHTPGTMAFFFDVKEGGKTYRVGYYGGVGFLSVYREFLAEYNQPLSVRDDFFASLDKVYGEEVDVVLGNHPSQNKTLEKREKMLADPNGSNPFICPTEWRTFLDTIREQLRIFIDAGY